jgi:hypothetical protein
MDKELGTNQGNRYTLITMIVSVQPVLVAVSKAHRREQFFVTYILFDYPSNICLRRLGAARWLGLIGT